MMLLLSNRRQSVCYGNENGVICIVKSQRAGEQMSWMVLHSTPGQQEYLPASGLMGQECSVHAFASIKMVRK